MEGFENMNTLDISSHIIEEVRDSITTEPLKDGEVRELSNESGTVSVIFSLEQTGFVTLKTVTDDLGRACFIGLAK